MKKIAFLASSVFVGAVLMTSCNGTGAASTTDSTGTKPAFDLSAAKKQIDSANMMFTEATTKGDSAGIASCYTSDAEFMEPNMPIVSGRSDIQKSMGNMISQGGVNKVEFKTKDVWGNADLLAEEGVATVYVKGAAVEEDKYIALWKKEDGKWKIFRDIFNSNKPEPAHK